MTDMPMMFSATSALMTAAMMVAMMLPSLAATLRRYHRDLRTMRMPRAGERTMLFAAAYAGVWTAVGLLLFAMSAGPASLGLRAAANAPLASLVSGTVVFCAGLLQSSRWKAKQLDRCQRSCLPALVATKVSTALHDGRRFGLDCAVSCAAPMAVLLAAGLMNVSMMVIVTAAIAAERVVPGGARIARLTGTIALVAGMVICLRAASFHLDDLRDARHLSCTVHDCQRDALSRIVPERHRCDRSCQGANVAELPPVADDPHIVAR